MKFSLVLILLFITANLVAQLPALSKLKMGAYPIFFLDSVETSLNVMPTLNPLDISNITVVQKKKAKKLLGDKGADGAIYVTTLKYAKECYWKFLCSASNQYKQLIGLTSGRYNSTI